VFLGGAVGMVLELVGSRLLAPYFGNSLFVWTALIGIMLGFMSLGNFLGGRLADRLSATQGSQRSAQSLLFWILAGASFSIALVSFVDAIVLLPLAEVASIRVGSVLGATILFAIPCMLLGMISPICIRLVMERLDSAGSTVGSFYALATLGSIAGTFAGGFWLIAFVGSHHLIGWLALIPLLLAIFYAPKRTISTWILVGLCALVITLALVTSAYAGNQFDSNYDWYYIGEAKGYEEGANAERLFRYLARDFFTMESAVYLDNSEPVLFNYYRFYDLALEYASGGNAEWDGSTLLIGGGVLSYPRRQVALYPQSTTDVVEIDPMLYDVAKQEFFFQPNPLISIFLEDGRMFLNRSSEIYDVVILDAFKSASSIPFQLTTVESMTRCAERLDEDGVLVMNIIGNATYEGSRFVVAQYLTLKEVFPSVEVYYVYGIEDDAHGSQNISFMCCKKKAIDFNSQLARLSPELTRHRIDPSVFRDDVAPLTDDFAPVDQYLMDLRQ
jgi:predicted membrane-bound spermidine synthase